MWWIPVIIIVIVLGIAFVGCIVFSAASNRLTWKDNLAGSYSTRCTCGWDNRIGRIHDPGCKIHPDWKVR